MTARAHDSFCVAVLAIAIDGCSYGFVAMAACTFDHLMVELCDLDGVGIVAAGEIEGVPETVIRFYGVLANDFMWSVKVFTGSSIVVSRLDPSIILLPHDMAVDAGLGIVREV